MKYIQDIDDFKINEGGSRLADSSFRKWLKKQKEKALDKINGKKDKEKEKKEKEKKKEEKEKEKEKERKEKEKKEKKK